MSIKQLIIDSISQQHKALSSNKIEPFISDQLFSPFVVRLPTDVLNQAQNFVKNVFQLRQKQSYLQSLNREIKENSLIDPGNKSILMSYDFHLSPEGTLKLIEINTNASFLLLGDFLYRAQSLKQPVANFSMKEILANVSTELTLNGQKGPAQIAIIDDHPEQQKLYIEFLLYHEFFKENGVSSVIADFRSLPSDVNFIYNRYTDFYLNQPESLNLRKAFIERRICFSPNPFEYLLLADKQRMIDWWNADFLQSSGASEEQTKILQKHVPQAVNVSRANAEQLWSNKKTLFFKPKNAYGSKQTYRGEKISRKLFESLLDQNFIAQEFIPAPEVSFSTPEGDRNFKYDLRFYAYQDRVQSVVARVYQGQVTNLKTPLGGFAAVEFY